MNAKNIFLIVFLKKQNEYSSWAPSAGFLFVRNEELILKLPVF